VNFARRSEQFAEVWLFFRELFFDCRDGEAVGWLLQR